MGGRWSLRQPLSPLGSGFRRRGPYECQMAPKGLGSLFALTPPGLTEPPPVQEVSFVTWQKSLFWAFVCLYRCGALVNVCLHPSEEHAISLASQWTKRPTEYWELLTEQCKGMERGVFFLHVFEQPWPALHVPVGLAPELGRGPRIFSSSHCLSFCFYTCFFKVTFSPIALLLAWIYKGAECLRVFWLAFGKDMAFYLEKQYDNIRLNCQISWKISFSMHQQQVLS